MLLDRGCPAIPNLLNSFKYFKSYGGSKTSLSYFNNFPKVARSKFLGSDKLLYFISISKFGKFKKPLATITCLSELSLKHRRFILMGNAKEVIFMSYDSRASS